MSAIVARETWRHRPTRGCDIKRKTAGLFVVDRIGALDDGPDILEIEPITALTFASERTMTETPCAQLEYADEDAAE